ncbi:MAG: DUF1499 domain-containing protein [Casimicrobiaceae bacterium]
MHYPRRLLPLLALTVAPVAMAALFGSLFAGTMPADLGVHDGRLKACPDRPNCVNSQATDARHVVAPLAFRGDAAAAMNALAAVVAATPGATIIAARENYLQATFTTPTMGFVDDVEVHADVARKVIHVRSASRLGHSDLDANRNRVEALRRAFAAVNP